MNKKFMCFKIALLATSLIFWLGCSSQVDDDSDSDSKNVTVTYETERGTKPEPLTKASGYALTQDDLPVLSFDKWTFDGWFLNGSKIEADYVVKQDITLTAKWTEWGTVSSPSFTPAASSVNLDEKISITCATSGAEIHYTKDGSEPTANSTKYTGAITIDDSVSTNNVCTIKAIAIKQE